MSFMDERLKITKTVNRGATSGTIVKVSVVDENGNRSTFSHRTTQGAIGRDMKWVERQALANLEEARKS